MSNILSKVFIFATGAAIGSFVTWKLVKDKYEQRAQEDIDAMEDYYTKREKRIMSESKEERHKDISDFTEEELNEKYQEVLGKTGYSNQSEKEEEKMPIAPYVIPPEEVGEADYPIETLTFYADGTLTNEFDEPIVDIDGTVGEDSLTHFGEYEDDSVFVRNEELETDFEILLDTRNYEDL